LLSTIDPNKLKVRNGWGEVAFLVKYRLLLVEDNRDDVDLALHARKREKLTNHIFVARDGEEALDFLFCRGTFVHRSVEHPPKLVSLDRFRRRRSTSKKL
jgi:hypothetical protein